MHFPDAIPITFFSDFLLLLHYFIILKKLDLIRYSNENLLGIKLMIYMNEVTIEIHLVSNGIKFAPPANKNLFQLLRISKFSLIARSIKLVSTYDVLLLIYDR